MARFVQRVLTSSQISDLSKDVVAKYYVCKPSELNIVNIASTAPASQWIRYGTNASFFASNGNMAAFHINAGSSVRVDGDKNCADANVPATRMDCMYGQYYSVGNSYSAGIAGRTNTPPVSSGTNSILWAIGGFDLLVSGSYSTSATLKTAIDNRFKTGTAPVFNGNITDAWLPRYGDKRGRTVIGYKSSTGEVIFGIFVGGTEASPLFDNAGPTVFELHKIMKYLGCSSALLLDGGGSSQVKWKSVGTDTNKNKGYYNGDNRKVYCQIALTTDAANNCSNWNATT